MLEKMQAYSYRVQGRFGSVVDIEVDETNLSIIGSRLSPGLYNVWLYSQAVVLVAFVFALITSIATWSLIWLLVALGLFAIHGGIGGVGAGCLWELEKLIQFGEGQKGNEVTFEKPSIQDIKVGKGWARGSIAWIIAPYVPGINKMAKDMAVSFSAPDGILPGRTVYALHFRSKEDASKFRELISTGDSA